MASASISNVVRAIMLSLKKQQSPGKLETIPRSPNAPRGTPESLDLVEQATPTKLRKESINELTGEVEHLGKGPPAITEKGSGVTGSQFEDVIPDDVTAQAIEDKLTKWMNQGALDNENWTRQQFNSAKRKLEKLAAEEVAEEAAGVRAPGTTDNIRNKEGFQDLFGDKEAKALNKEKRIRRAKGEKLGDPGKSEPPPQEVFGEVEPLPPEGFPKAIGPRGKTATVAERDLMDRLVPTTEQTELTSAVQNPVAAALGILKGTTPGGAIHKIGQPKSPKQPVIQGDPTDLRSFDTQDFQGGGQTVQPTKIPEGASGFDEIPEGLDTAAKKRLAAQKKDIKASKDKEGGELDELEDANRRAREIGEQEAREAFDEGVSNDPTGFSPVNRGVKPAKTGDEFSTDNQAASELLDDLQSLNKQRGRLAEDVQDQLDLLGDTGENVELRNLIIHDITAKEEVSQAIQDTFKILNDLRAELPKNTLPGKRLQEVRILVAKMRTELDEAVSAKEAQDILTRLDEVMDSVTSPEALRRIPVGQRSGRAPTAQEKASAAAEQEIVAKRIPGEQFPPDDVQPQHFRDFDRLLADRVKEAQQGGVDLTQGQSPLPRPQKPDPFRVQHRDNRVRR